MNNTVTSSITLQYANQQEFDLLLKERRQHILGAAAFGQKPLISTADIPSCWVNLPLLNGDTVWEVCLSEQPVVRESKDCIAISKNEDFLFGVITVEEQEDIEQTAFFAYSHLFDVIDRHSYTNLLRIWNYFPRINEQEDGLERYRGFSIGRHNAFEDKGRDIQMEKIPAACALGCKSGPLVVYFLASKHTGLPVENPRQTSAYHYPAQYGPKSPTFSRAMIAKTKTDMPLLISGTASIVGHETLHLGNPYAQAKETIENIQTVVHQASLTGWVQSQLTPQGLLKVYLRDSSYLENVESQIKLLGPNVKAIYLEADICRADLLLEIEGIYL